MKLHYNHDKGLENGQSTNNAYTYDNNGCWVVVRLQFTYP